MLAEVNATLNWYVIRGDYPTGSLLAECLTLKMHMARLWYEVGKALGYKGVDHDHT